VVTPDEPQYAAKHLKPEPEVQNEPFEEPAAEEEPVEPVEETPPEFSPEEEALIEELQASAERVSVLPRRSQAS